MARSIIHALILFLFRLLSRMELQGLENIPADGPGLLTSNHLGRLDGPLVFAMLRRPNATALVADTYYHILPVRWLVQAVGGIWLNRQSSDLRALRAAQNYIEQGGLLGIAPEGTRSHTGGIIAPKTGAAYLAEKTRCQIVPFALWGTEDAVAQLLRLRRPKIYVRVGQPYYLPPLERGDRAAGLERNTDEIMLRIAVLLPEQYRGVYADHPRLPEFLNNESSGLAGK